MKRRDFLGKMTAAAGLAAASGALPALGAENPQPGGAESQTATVGRQTSSKEMIYRTLGQTGERISAIGNWRLGHEIDG